MERVRGLDTIRAVCAFWVVMGHCGGPPITAGIDTTSHAGWFVNGVYKNFWNGPAAVIVFFVISGFCIHYPFARSHHIPTLVGYSARRYLRIGIPLGVAMAMSPFLGVELYLFHDSILWSLAAELVYYTLYPALLTIRRRGVCVAMDVGRQLCCRLRAGRNRPRGQELPVMGGGLNWVLGLPCWLAGCELAERVAAGRLLLLSSIWQWRFSVWGVSVALSVLRFHSPLGYPWTLNVFAVLVAYWLIREISWYVEREPADWLEWAGQWSYSVYLVHVPANAIFATLSLPNLGPAINWLVQMGFILATSYVFYLVVELPSHIAARAAGRALACRQTERLPQPQEP